MSQPRLFPKIRITEAVIIAAIPPFSYLLLWLYYQPQFEHYNVPMSLFRPNSMQALLLGVGLAIFFVLAYVLAQLITRLIPERHPLLLRLKRFVGVMLVPEFLFGTINLFARGYLPAIQYFLLVQLWLSPLTLYLLLGDFVIPLVRHRKAKGLRAKFGQKADLQMYRKHSTYLLTKVRVVVPALFILVGFIAYTLGTRATRGWRSYTIIHSNPQQIVLINYGDKMLTAELEQKSDKRYVYHPNFKLLNASDLNKDTFSYVLIDKALLTKD